MAMKEIKQLVRRWVNERVVSENDAEMDSHVALGDFYDWLRDQEDAERVDAPQWGSAMKQMGFPQTRAENKDKQWVVKGIELK